MSRKRKVEDHEMIRLIEKCSAHVQNKLPPKLKHPRNFDIPCTIGHLNFSNGLCDLDVSVSLIPFFIAWSFDLKEMKDTNIALQLASRFIKCSISRIENVFIKMKSFIILVYFIVLDTKQKYTHAYHFR